MLLLQLAVGGGSSFKLETSHEVSTKFIGSSFKFSFECDLWLTSSQSLISPWSMSAPAWLFFRDDPPPELGISLGISKSRGLKGGVRDPLRLRGGSSASSKSIDLRKWGCCIMASFIKALNCNDSKMGNCPICPTPFCPPPPPPFLAK